jgi:aspartyl-tRNA synthetase
VTKALANCAFAVFKGAVEAGGVVRVLHVPPELVLSRKDLDALPAVVLDRGAKGVAWCRVGAEWAGPAAKHLSPAERDALRAATGATDGSTLLFLAGPKSVAVPASGDLRHHIGRRFDLAKPGDFKPLWVLGFPVVEWNADEKRWDSVHHPFTAPHAADVALLDSDPGRMRSHGYDLTLNGVEILGGSVRIHDATLQRRIFKLIGLTDAQIEEQFTFLLKALAFGAPPHGGFAMGTDRMCAVLMGLSNIRDVIAFPKTTSASDLMTGAPSGVEQKQLDELGLRLA